MSDPKRKKRSRRDDSSVDEERNLKKTRVNKSKHKKSKSDKSKDKSKHKNYPSSSDNSSGGDSSSDKENRSRRPVGGKFAERLATRNDTNLEEHPSWAQLSLSDLQIERVNIRTATNVS